MSKTSEQLSSLLKPLIDRIDLLERQNQQLTDRVRHLQSMVSPQKSYQKLTSSALNHLRQSRLYSRDSDIQKRPNWNSKTKVPQSPIKPSEISSSNEKAKSKPPIPKIVKSPHKERPDETKTQASDKKITGGTKVAPAANNQQSERVAQIKIEVNGQKQVVKMSFQQERMERMTVEPKPNKFQELVKMNNMLINSMKQSNQVLPSNNMVSKAPSPRSEYHSKTGSPNSRSFISEAPDKQFPATNQG